MTRLNTSTVGAAGLRISALDVGLDVGLGGTAAELPGDGWPAVDAYRLTARIGGAYVLVGVRGTGLAPAERIPDVSLRPGDICFYDANHPPLPDFPERSRLKVFLVPREELGLEDDDVRRILATPVARSSRLGTLVSPFLAELADTAVSAEPLVGEMLARNAVNLLATLATEQLGRTVTDTPGTYGTPGTSGAPGSRSPLVARVLWFVDEHLAEADLSPEVIARAHHISVRYLHKLFQDEGTTVGRWIQR
ncbi:AraC family transcriptional regulator, partial [Streptomyces scabiei]|uniref:AraC family transcriptional regulator n=1 Tax=Streptomyces scabiei TaxID=1930 RepID=UPI000A3D2E0B